MVFESERHLESLHFQGLLFPPRESYFLQAHNFYIAHLILEMKPDGITIYIKGLQYNFEVKLVAERATLRHFSLVLNTATDHNIVLPFLFFLC